MSEKTVYELNAVPVYVQDLTGKEQDGVRIDSIARVVEYYYPNNLKLIWVATW